MKIDANTLVVVALSYFLVSCFSSNDPDSGTEGVSGEPVAINGVASDGYVAGALIYWDTNENYLLDPWEPSAFTDNDGYFSFSKPDAEGNRIDYCGINATALQQQFCLQTFVSSSNAVIRLVGGFDIFSGEPFKGALSLRTVLPFSNSTSPPVLSPLSTIYAQIDTNLNALAQEQKLNTLFGIEGDIRTLDFLNNAEGGIDAELFELALKLHKSVDLITTKLEQHYPFIGEESDLPIDLSHIVYRAYFQQLLTLDSLDAIDSDFYRQILIAAETELRSIIALANVIRREDSDTLLVLPGLLSDIDTGNRIGQDVVGLNSLVESLFGFLVDDSDTSADQNTDARSLQRAIEIVVQKVVDEDLSASDNSIDAAIDLALGTNGVSIAQRDAYLQALSQTDNDISLLFENDFSDPAGVVSTVTVSDIDIFSPQNETVSLAMGGTKMRLAGEETDEDSSKVSFVDVVFYFQGESSDTSGNLAMCATYQENVGVNEDDDLDKEFFTGTWELVTSLNDSTVLIKVSLAGGDFSLVVKSIGVKDGEPKYRFNFQGDLRTFDSVSINPQIANSARIPIGQALQGAIDDGGVLVSSTADCANAMSSPASK